MTMCARFVDAAARRVGACAVVSILTAGSVLAQDARAAGTLTFSAAVAAAAVDTSPVSAVAGEPQVPAPAPATMAARQDAATMNFFQRMEISGFVDTYYSYNGNKPSACSTVGGVSVFNCLYNFNVAHNSFSLNLAEVAFEKKPTADSRAGFRFDLDYGPTAAMVHAFEPGGTSIYQHIEQAYVSFLAPAGGGLQFDVGKFVTPMGNEVIETKDNWNYSRSLLFALAIPYYHTGLRAAYTVNDQVTITGFLVNGWNNVSDNNTGKTVGVGLGIKPVPALGLVLNYLGGPEQTDNNDDWRHTVDATATVAIGPMLSVAANYDYGQDMVAGAKVKWQGVAGYLRIQPTAWFALTPRAEYYDDKNAFTTGVVQKLKEVTVTGELKHRDGITLRLEYRGDFSDTPFFLKSGSALVKNQNTFTIGMIYAFSTKTS